MKKIVSIILSLSLILCFFGCEQKSDRMTLHFFYPRNNFGYDELEGRFFQESATEELRNDIEYRTSQQVIEQYLLGPLDPSLVNPFPAGTQLVSIRAKGKVLHMILTNQLSELTGVSLIMACACLAKTAITLTNTTKVQIRCESTMLDGQTSIIMDKDTVFFNDPIMTDDKN
jgi:hypothetical protein